MVLRDSVTYCIVGIPRYVGKRDIDLFFLTSIR